MIHFKDCAICATNCRLSLAGSHSLLPSPKPRPPNSHAHSSRKSQSQPGLFNRWLCSPTLVWPSRSGCPTEKISACSWNQRLGPPAMPRGITSFLSAGLSIEKYCTSTAHNPAASANRSRFCDKETAAVVVAPEMTWSPPSFLSIPTSTSTASRSTASGGFAPDCCFRCAKNHWTEFQRRIAGQGGGMRGAVPPR